MGKFVKWVLLAILLGVVLVALGGTAGFVAAGFYYRDWDLSWDWSVAAQPVAIVIASIISLAAAGVALLNGQKTRKQDKEIHEEKSQAEQERTLRERFTSIAEMLSNKEADFTKRISGAYALAALADDWAVFYKDDPESSLKEQQVCLNILTGQLHDRITENSPDRNQLLEFKKRVQDIIFSRFIDPKNNRKAGAWSNLELNLSNCQLYDVKTNGFFNQHTSFSGVTFAGESHFIKASFSSVNFENSSFKEGAFFNEAEFNDTANFCKTTFSNVANFYRTKFNYRCSFSWVKFRELANFQGATFRDFANFSGSTFFKTINFRESIFHTGTNLFRAERNESIIMLDSRCVLQKLDNHADSTVSASKNLRNLQEIHLAIPLSILFAITNLTK